MGTINKNVLGDFKGRIGNIVVRTLNGKPVVSVRPASYKSSKSEKSKSNKNRFAVAVKFASYINAIEQLSHVWKSADIEGTLPFNRILKYNIPLSSAENLTEKNIITPPGYIISLENFVVEKDFIEVKIKTGYANKSKIIPDEICMFIIMYLSSNEKIKNKQTEFNHFLYAIKPDKNLTSYNFLIQFDSNMKRQLSNYKKCNFYFAEVCDLGVKGKLKWSSTLSRQLIIKQ